MGFELLNVTKNRDNPTEPCFIFERTDDFIKAFDAIQDEIMSKRKDKDIGLTEFERDFVCDILIHKRDEYKALGVKSVDTLDSIIDKLGKADRVDTGEDDKPLDDKVRNDKGSEYKPIENDLLKGLTDEQKEKFFESIRASSANAVRNGIMGNMIGKV